MEETHSTGFELRRHFFSRFFESDLVSTPGQLRVVAIGAFGIVVSSSLMMAQGTCSAMEYQRMVAEKAAAAQSATLALMTGGSPTAVLAPYVTRARANAKRLRRSS